MAIPAGYNITCALVTGRIAGMNAAWSAQQSEENSIG